MVGVMCIRGEVLKGKRGIHSGASSVRIVSPIFRSKICSLVFTQKTVPSFAILAIEMLWVTVVTISFLKKRGKNPEKFRERTLTTPIDFSVRKRDLSLKTCKEQKTFAKTATKNVIKITIRISSQKPSEIGQKTPKKIAHTLVTTTKRGLCTQIENEKDRMKNKRAINRESKEP